MNDQARHALSQARHRVFLSKTIGVQRAVTRPVAGCRQAMPSRRISPRLTAVRAASEATTARVTRGSRLDDAAHVDPEAEGRHRYDGQRVRRRGHGVHSRFGKEPRRAETCQRQEGEDEPRHQPVQRHPARGGALPFRQGRCGRVRLSPQPARAQRESQDHRPEHQHADQLDQGSDLDAESRHRSRSSQHLRYGIDRESREHAVLHRREPEQRHEQGQAEHDEDSEHGGERDGRGDVLAVRADHRGRRRDRRVPTDRVAAGDEDGEARGQPEGPADAVASSNGESHHPCDADEQSGPRRKQRTQAQRSAEQDDGDLQDGLGAERDTANEARPRAPGCADGRPKTMARTSASSQARPKRCASIPSRARAAPVTARHRIRPGRTGPRARLRDVKKVVADMVRTHRELDLPRSWPRPIDHSNGTYRTF